MKKLISFFLLIAFLSINVFAIIDSFSSENPGPCDDPDDEETNDEYQCVYCMCAKDDDFEFCESYACVGYHGEYKYIGTDGDCHEGDPAKCCDDAWPFPNCIVIYECDMFYEFCDSLDRK
ncbi:hypothetical protein AMJ80_02670 [bacterium SM23_31]|nr:MAG: hypothetical protein AMJ80_02670 [bacterium SM23_31]